MSKIKKRWCGNCRRDVVPEMPGQGWIEFLLYFVYFFPGLFYSIWRRAEKNKTICPRCRNKHTQPE